MGPPYASNGEVSHWVDTAWIGGATRGAEACARALVRQGYLPGCQVTVVRVVGVLVDATVAGFECAGALATWQALAPEISLPAVEWDGEEYRVRF